MAGLYFYWFGWMLWIIIYFFWRISDKRFWNGLFILLCLAMLPINLSMMGQVISMSYLLATIYLCWEMKNDHITKLLYFMVVSWTIGAAYSALQLMILFDPVLTMIDERWMSACLVFILSYILAGQLKNRLIISILGLLLGDFLLTFVLKHHMGGPLLFDKIAINTLLYGIVWCLFTLSAWLNRIIETKINDTTYRQIS